jgi:hypothetical protein
MPNLYEIAEKLPENAWRRLQRRPKYEVKTEPRGRRENVKEKIVQQREFENIKLVGEHVAEFEYRPVKCKKTYRVVVVWKELEVKQGQRKLFDDSRCFFYGPPGIIVGFVESSQEGSTNARQGTLSGHFRFGVAVVGLGDRTGHGFGRDTDPRISSAGNEIQLPGM